MGKRKKERKTLDFDIVVIVYSESHYLWSRLMLCIYSYAMMHEYHKTHDELYHHGWMADAWGGGWVGVYDRQI